MSPDQRAAAVLDALDPEQQEAARVVRGPLCILAGAGTGKTRTITHRVAYAVHLGVMPADQVLAVTFTARAAGEMRARLRGLGVGGVQARTFHAAALRQLGYFWPRLVGGRAPEIVGNKLRLVGQAAARARVQTDRTVLRDLASEIEWAKASLVTPAGYAAAATAAGREPPVAPAVMATLMTGYEEAKTRAGEMDFDDVLLLMAAAIEDHRDVAEEVRARYRHFVVDEYQDVTPLQQRMLDAWLGGREDLCVVGDAQQTIYSFAGASPQRLLDFRRRYPRAHLVKLVRDYRSTPQVVGLANAVISRAAASGPFAAARLDLRGMRPDGPGPTFAEHDDEPAEAAAVAARAKALLTGGTPASEVAVLFRINAQSEVYEAALATAGVPYVLKGGTRFFDRPEVREAVMLLRGAARAVDDAAPETLVAAVLEVLANAGFDPAAQPGATGAVRDRWESLNALVGLAGDLAAADPAARLGALVSELEERASAQHAPTVEGVTLASLHAAKGLEWDAVFLVGLTDGTLPLVHADTPDAVEEERRLLYVGVTRAREHLMLSWARSRNPGGRGTRRPSRFLDDLVPAGVSRGAPVRSRKPRGTPVLGDDVDPELFERLRVWRSGKAKEQSVPAFVVFTDATLAAVAGARPRDVPALVALPGIGQNKLDRYGAELLALVAGEDPQTPPGQML